MKLILNEKSLLYELLVSGYIDTNKPSNTIRILAKHYLSIGMNKRQTTESINVFFEKHYDGYNSVSWNKTIEGIINTIIKNKDYKLVDIDNVSISEDEIIKIKELNNLKLEKLMFVLLVYSKIYNQINGNGSNWVNEQHKYIFSDAKITVKIEDQGKLIHQLSELGYVEISKMVDCTNMKVNMNFENSIDIAIKITDFRNFVYEYLRYLEPNKYTNCNECGLLIKCTNNKIKYCKECAREKQLEWQRESMKKSRKNVK